MRGAGLKLPHGIYGLSARLLVLTIAFVMLAEILIFAPSVARFRQDWLGERIVSGHLAALALEATPDNMVSDELKAELLTLAGAHTVIIARPGQSRRVLSADMPPEAAATFDLREVSSLRLVADALAALFDAEERVIRVVGVSSRGGGARVDVLLDEAPMRRAMIEYGLRVLGLSVGISLFAAALVFMSLQWLIVRPLQRLAENMTAFRDAPENSDNVIQPSLRTDEIGLVQRQLSEMEGTVRSALRQQARLAALGTAVAKINHDLRNILTTARLVSDRLADSNDPKVRSLAPRVVAAIDRAVSLCGQTLDYARDDLPKPVRSRFRLGELVDDVGRVVGLLTDERAKWENATPPDFELDADRDQMFRLLVNLGRNAVEAGATRVSISAAASALDRAVIDIGDDGPGLPPKARENLFTPFAGSARAGGTGLGLAIAREIVRSHGGELTLVKSAADGTIFRIELPWAALEPYRSAEGSVLAKRSSTAAQSS